MPIQTKQRRTIDVAPGEEIVFRSKDNQDLILSANDQGSLSLKPSSFVMDGVDYKNKELYFSRSTEGGIGNSSNR